MKPLPSMGFIAGPDVSNEERAIARNKVDQWTRARKLLAYAQGGNRVDMALKQFPRKMWNFKPARKNWCLGEVLWHLADHEANVYVRLRRAVAEPGKPAIPYDQKRWASRLLYAKAPFEQARDIIVLLNRANAELLKRIPPSAWKAKIQHPERGLISVEWMVGMNIWHTEHHIGQMEKRFREWETRKRSKNKIT